MQWSNSASFSLPSGIHHPTFHRCEFDSFRSLKLMKSSAFKLWNGKGEGCNTWVIFLLCQNAGCPIFLGWRKSLQREGEEESWGLGMWSLHPSLFLERGTTGTLSRHHSREGASTLPTTQRRVPSQPEGPASFDKIVHERPHTPCATGKHWASLQRAWVHWTEVY